MSYRKGARLEYWVKQKLEKNGYYVVRSAGSHGVADLIAFKRLFLPYPHPEVLFIQVSAKPKPVAEIEELVNLCHSLMVTPCLVFKKGSRLNILKGSEVTAYLDAKRLKPTADE